MPSNQRRPCRDVAGGRAELLLCCTGSLSRRAGPVFTERVTRLLGAHPNPGPGDVDRAVRQALVGLWTPPAIEEFQRPPRWGATPAFERVSKRAW